MPELVEVEYYRRLAERALHRKIARVHAPDAWFLKRGLTATVLRRALRGRHFVAARRIGKLLLLDVDDGAVLGLHFGMSGRLIVDSTIGVDDLVYASRREEPAWDRLRLLFIDGGRLLLRDPRRLGAVELDPDETRLGPDAATVSPAAFRKVLGVSTVPVKARLLDQSRLAGVGNLIADETLWRAGLDPARPVDSLEPADLRTLHRHLRRTVADLLARGGSHTGDLMMSRMRGGVCPRDGAPLLRRTVGGRTTYSCPAHQR